MSDNDEKAAPVITITGEMQTVHQSHDCRVSVAVESGRLQLLVEDQRMGEFEGKPFFASASYRNFPIGEDLDEINGREAIHIAALMYRSAVRDADAAWMANGRRGASQEAVDAVNRARARAKQAHDHLMAVVGAYNERLAEQG